ncbi:MAG: monovalent cation/H+ antiporter complex subunit F [Desulfobacterales bacterium]|jgi:multicomponent Na+:H+ antiporter subunit F
MTISDSALVQSFAGIGLFILTLGMVLVIYCIIRGPKNADRIIGLDLLSVLLVALVALLSVYTGAAVFLDVAIAYALVAFLGTVAFARYVERSTSNRSDASLSERKGNHHG